MKRIRKPMEEYLFFHADFVARKPTLTTQEEIDEYKIYRRLEDSSFASDVVTDYKQKSYMFPKYNRISTITVAFVNNGKLRVNTIEGKNDKDILEEFYEIINKTPTLSLCGYNMVAFQLPALRKKAMACGISLKDMPVKIIDSLKKPWDLTDSFLELSDVYKGTSPYNTTIEDACDEIGIVNWKGKIMNREELTKAFYSEKGREAIINHSRLVMVGQLIPLFTKMMGQEEALKDTKSYIKVTNASIKAKTPAKGKTKAQDIKSPIDKLFVKGKAGCIDKETYPYFEDKIKSEKVKKNRERMVDVIYAQMDFPEDNIYLEKLRELI